MMNGARANQSLGRHARSHRRANYGFMVAAASFLQALAPHARAGAAAAKPDAGVFALGQTKHGLQLRRGFPGPDPTTAKAGLGRLAHHEHAPRPVQDRPPPNPQAWAGWRSVRISGAAPQTAPLLKILDASGFFEKTEIQMSTPQASGESFQIRTSRRK